MTKGNARLASLVLAGLMGGLVGAGFVLLIVSDAGHREEALTTSSAPPGTQALDRIHRDLERLIELNERVQPIAPSSTPSQRTEVRANDTIPPGLIPALGSLEEALRELNQRPLSTGKFERDFRASRQVRSKAADESALEFFLGRLQSNPELVLDEYFGAAMARIFSEFGRPDDISSDSGTVWWFYKDVGENEINLNFRFINEVVVNIDD